MQVDEVVVVLDEPDKELISGMRNIAKKISPKLTIIKNMRRMGIGYALIQGLDYAVNKRYDVVVVMAGNGKDDPKEIPLLLRKIAEGYDYVQGSRYLDRGKHFNMPLTRKIITRIMPVIWSIVTRKWQTEVSNGFRAYKTSLIKDRRVNIHQRWLYKYALEYYIHYKAMTLKNYKATEVPVSKKYPEKGEYTKIKPYDWVHMLMPLFLSRFR